MDWKSWKPSELATECFVVRDGQILLIRKKRGLGAGKLVGPGGRFEAGETALECAIRELEEELHITPTGVVARGELDFQFADGYAIRVFVFSATSYRGEPTETDEAIPAWHPLDALPYPEMWADNPHWVPLLLRGTPFSGRYMFDGDKLLDHETLQRFDARRAHRTW